MPIHHRSLGLLILLFLAGSHGAVAQSTFTVAAQGGLSVGAYEQARTGVDMSPKPSAGVRIEYRPLSLLGLYVGYSYARFGCTGGFCGGGGVTFTSSGPTAGLRFGVLGPSGGMWIRGGATYRRLQSTSGNYAYTSNRGLGAEAGLGGTVPLTSSLALVPELMYTRYVVTNDAGGTSAVVAISGRLGLQLSL